MEMVKGKYKAEWSDIGEGWNGMYNPDDPHDEALLRFDTYELINGEWEAIDDGSYCTQVPVGTPDEDLAAGLSMLLEALDDCAGSPKKMLEGMSWMSPSWLKGE